MRIAVIGATGFIGDRVTRLLVARGHSVRPIARDRDTLVGRFPQLDCRALPPLQDGQAEDPALWSSLLAGLDGVVCAAGTLAGPALIDVHARLPAILVSHAAAMGIGRFVHISAVGADAAASTAFLRSKAAGEHAVLHARPPGWTVLRPSLVYGRGGGSAALFAGLAGLPVRLRLGGGPVRPVAVEDAVAAVAACLETDAPLPPTMDVVGPDRMTVDDYVTEMALWLGVRPIVSITVPDRLLDGLACILPRLGSALIGPETIRMLRQGADGDPALLPARTGVVPVGLAAGLRRDRACGADRFAAHAALLLPLLHATLAVLWIGTGILSLWSYGTGIELLRASGITGPAAGTLLIGGSFWDLALGLAMACHHHRGRIAGLQAATILAYTGLATLLAPTAWMHPFGPLLKNIPIFAATLLAASTSR